MSDKQFARIIDEFEELRAHMKVHSNDLERIGTRMTQLELWRNAIIGGLTLLAFVVSHLVK